MIFKDISVKNIKKKRKINISKTGKRINKINKFYIFTNLNSKENPDKKFKNFIKNN